MMSHMHGINKRFGNLLMCPILRCKGLSMRNWECLKWKAIVSAVEGGG